MKFDTLGKYLELDPEYTLAGAGFHQYDVKSGFFIIEHGQMVDTVQLTVDGEDDVNITINFLDGSCDTKHIDCEFSVRIFRAEQEMEV